MEVVFVPYDELSGPIRASVTALLAEAFPDVGENYYGSQDPWGVVLGCVDDRPVAHVAVYIRRVLIDCMRAKIGMIGGVAVAPAFRRGGVAKALILDAHRRLGQLHVDFAVLFAFDHGHYASSGYRPMKNETRFIEDGEIRQFVYRGGMVAELGHKKWSAAILDLKGEVI